MMIEGLNKDILRIKMHGKKQKKKERESEMKWWSIVLQVVIRKKGTY